MTIDATSPPISVLVIEDDEQFARYLALALASTRQGVFSVEIRDRLHTGLERLESDGIDVVLLDLELPDAAGLATLDRVVADHPDLAVVVLTGTAEAEELAVTAVCHGAEDYIFKGSVSDEIVARALRYAVERRRVRQALERRSRELARSNAELEQFATVASHDLQEPLRTITSYLELLAGRIGDGDRQALDYLNVARDAAARGGALIRDLLQLARVTTRARPFAPLDANESLRRALGDLRTLVAQSGASVTSDDLPVVIADGAQLRSVFQNLLENAMKYRAATPPAIHVAARRSGADFIFSVRDNGIGIAPADHARIFETFERLHPQHRFGGTGIGLAIVRKIVERHGGRVWLESEEGAGATFHFSIPRFRPPPADAPPGSSRPTTR